MLLEQKFFTPLMEDAPVDINRLKSAAATRLAKYNISSLNDVFVLPGYTHFDKILDDLSQGREPYWKRKTSELIKILVEDFGCKPTPGAVPGADGIVRDALNGKYDIKSAAEKAKDEEYEAWQKNGGWGKRGKWNPRDYD